MLPEAPKVGQRVKVKGRRGVYIVLRSDVKELTADVMLTSGTHELRENVPYLALKPVREKRARRREIAEAISDLLAS